MLLMCPLLLCIMLIVVTGGWSAGPHSASWWEPLKVAVAEAGGWKPTWVAGKLDSMWHSLSARAHEVRALQGLEREAVVISAKVLSGECAYTHDGRSGRFRRGETPVLPPPPCPLFVSF